MGVAVRVSSLVVVLAACLCTPNAEATDYLALHLYQSVQISDVIVLGTITDANRATVRVDKTLKGRPNRSIHLVEYIDGMNRDKRPLVAGTQELMFLKRKDDGYAPLQRQYGRWPVRNGRLEAPPHVGLLGLSDYRRTIGSLINLQATAGRGGAGATNAYVKGLHHSDPQVRLWAAHSAYQDVSEPSAALVDAYLEQWSTGDGELRGSMANAMEKWGVLLATALREGDEPERITAARALGRTGDRSFVPQLRAVAGSDRSEKVRGYAFEALMHLLAGESIPDAMNGARDPHESVRRSVAIHAFDMTRDSVDTELRAEVRQLLTLLADDASAHVQQTVRSLLKQFDATR